MVDFNSKKTELVNVLLKKNKSQPVIMFKNEIVKQVHEHKHLGLLLLEDMSWTKHIKQISTKAFNQIGLLRKNFSLHEF